MVIEGKIKERMKEKKARRKQYNVYNVETINQSYWCGNTSD